MAEVTLRTHAGRLAIAILGAVLGWMFAQFIVVVLLRDSLTLVVPLTRETQLILVGVGLIVGIARSYAPTVNPWLLTLGAAGVGIAYTLVFSDSNRLSHSPSFLTVDFLRWLSASLSSVAFVRVFTDLLARILR